MLLYKRTPDLQVRAIGPWFRLKTKNRDRKKDK